MKFSTLLKSVSLLLILSMVLSVVSCSTPPKASLSGPNSPIVSENIQIENTEVENIEEENIVYEHITTETYTKEIIEVENTITELLLEEDVVEEVYFVQTIYVSEENIDEFSQNSQVSRVFGENIDIADLLKKVAVGTGVIVTLVILKRAHIPGKLGSMVACAASESLKFGKDGAAIGSIFGGATGAADSVDSSGRTSAVIGFAVCTVGLILSIISFVAAIPSGGSSTITAAAGIHLALAGIEMMIMTAETARSGYNMVKSFQAKDASDIDWNNINWNDVGISSVEQSINGAANGYMWGSIFGAVHGGVDGLEFFEKYHTPYSTYNARLVKTPIEGGSWTGTRGESDFVLDNPIKLPNGKTVTKITYRNAVPDFSPFQVARVKIPNMTNNRYSIKRLNIKGNFEQADTVLAEYWSRIRYEGKANWTASDIATYRTNNGLTWHEMNDLQSMQLVPTEVNGTFGHLGGVGEYNRMTGKVVDYDPYPSEPKVSPSDPQYGQGIIFNPVIYEGDSNG